jgi:hypothetical protein
MFCSVIVVARDGEWEASNGIVYVVFMCIVLAHGVLASVLSKVMGKLQSLFVLLNLALILATIIALPVGRASSRNDGHYIFANIMNLTTWPTGWTFMLAWVMPPEEFIGPHVVPDTDIPSPAS